MKLSMHTEHPLTPAPQAAERFPPPLLGEGWGGSWRRRTPRHRSAPIRAFPQWGKE